VFRFSGSVILVVLLLIAPVVISLGIVTTRLAFNVPGHRVGAGLRRFLIFVGGGAKVFITVGILRSHFNSPS
jgi:hypothetical protein